jgi:hypothetical protein
MQDPLRIFGKAFTAGCAGAFGAWIATVICLLVILLLASNTLGTAFIQSLPPYIQFIPVYFHLGGTEALLPSGELPSMDLFMTMGANPDLQHLDSISSQSSTQVSFWAQAPKNIKSHFQVWLTYPDGHKLKFGEEYFTDGLGDPVELAGFSAEATPGIFMLQSIINGIPVGEFTFSVTEQ